MLRVRACAGPGPETWFATMVGVSSSSAGSSDALCAMSAADLGRLYRRGVVSPVDVVDQTLSRLHRLNPSLGAYLEIFDGQARTAAEAAHRQLASGIDLGPLHGIPVSVKDIFDVAGFRTTGASRVLENSPRAQVDAVVVRRLRQAGAIIIGKTNLAEFAHGDPDPSGPFPRVENPRKLGHYAGSSSSGSAAAVAAGLSVLSLGTQTGGSILNPASMCGVVGVKPSFGLVPRTGVIPVSSSLDHVGLLSRSVWDAAAGLDAIVGYDPGDPCSVAERLPNLTHRAESQLKVRAGIATNEMYSFGSPHAQRLLKEAEGVLSGLGFELIEVDLPRAEEISAALGTIAAAELAAIHAKYRGRERLYGPNMRTRLKAGRAISAGVYYAAQQARQEIQALWESVFESLEVIVLPENGFPAPRHDESTIEFAGDHHPALPALSDFNRPASLLGLPSLTQPIGLLDDGSPIGIQLIGRRWGEAALLSVARTLENAIGLPARWGIAPA